MSLLDGYEAPEWTEENQRYYVDQTKVTPPGVYIDCDIQSLIEEVVSYSRNLVTA